MLLSGLLRRTLPHLPTKEVAMKATYTERQADGRWVTVQDVKSVLDVSLDMQKADSQGRPWRFRTEDGVVFDNRNLLNVTKQFSYSRVGK